jgi:hypothetical protein
MIPKIIHCCWFGSDPFNPTIERCLASWRENLPSYEIRMWTDHNYPKHLSFAEELRMFRKWAQLSDYVRLYALLTEGGIYLDMDVEVLKSLDPFLENECFVGFEKDHIMHRCLSNAVIGAEKDHPFIVKNFEAFENSLRRRIRPYFGVTILNVVMFNHYGLSHYGTQRLHDVTVYEKDIFHPKQSSVPPGSFCVHWSLCSWHRKKGIVHDMRSLRYKLKRIRTILKHRFSEAAASENKAKYLDIPSRWPVKGDPRFYYKKY